MRRYFGWVCIGLVGASFSFALLISELSFHRRIETRGRNRALLDVLEAR